MDKYPKSVSTIFERNTKQINRIVANIMAVCSVVILMMAFLSIMGFFEFGTGYTYFVIIVGLFVSLSPKLFAHVLPDNFLKYYMLISASVFIGMMGTNEHIGIYITYALVPIMSCLYFEESTVVAASVISYLVMLFSVYIHSASMPEVIYEGYARDHIFLSYAAGFTFEYIVVTSILYGLVKRVNSLIHECDKIKHDYNNAEKERQVFNALCVNYSSAYFCDLMNDSFETIKQTEGSRAAVARAHMDNMNSYSEWIRYSYEHIVIRDSSLDYLEVFDADNLMRRLKTGKSMTYRLKTRKNNADHENFEVTVVRLYMDDSSFKVIVGYRPIDDLIVEEKEHQQKLEEALEKAEIANTAKIDFLHRMSHDIRTPLNGIIGLIKIDEAHYDDSGLIMENHKKMEVAANHLLSLINDVLQMSKLEDGPVELAHEPISLGDMTQDIVAIVVDRAREAGIEWDYDKEKTSIPYPYVYGSPLHLRQIFLNIYGNCIKYNRPDGKITTTVKAWEEQDGICTYQWTISDTGIGMSREFLKHVFEPFAQERAGARSRYQGTGLGMAIVKKLLDKMNGTIVVTSVEGEGSTFVITIPFEIASQEDMPLQTTVEDGSIRGMHLLVAEDNELNAEIAKTVFEDEGAKVTIVGNGQLAVEQFSNNSANTYDAILMDVMMPVMDGLAATKAIRTMNRDDAKRIPIIAMTANAFKEDAQKCMEAGMNAHLAKPLDIKMMKQTILNLTK